MHESSVQTPMSEPQRQSLLGVAVYMLKNFRALITIFIALFATMSSSAWFWSILGFIALPVLIVFGVFSYYQYRNFTFQVNDEALVIHKGVLFTERIVIDIDRIQSIHITENLVQRILGLVGLKVDTAGSKGSELEIPALERKKANALKDLLYLKKGVPTSQPEGSADANTDRTVSREKPTGKVLVRLGIKDLLLVGITENHLRTAVIALAFVFGTLSQYQKVIEEYIQGPVDAYAEQAIQSGLKVLLSLIVLFAVVSVLLSVFRTALRFYDLRAVLRSDAVEISTGLIKRNSFRVPIRKIQYVSWESNPLRRWAGFESAVLKPSSSVDESTNKNQRIEIPALRIRESAVLAEGLFPGFTIPEYTLAASPMAYARIIALIGALMLVPAFLAVFYSFGIWSAALLTALPVLAWLGYMYGRTVRVHFDSGHLVVHKGWFFIRKKVLPTYKIQALSIHENIFIARRNLCHLRMYTAAGEVSVRYLPAADTRKLYDYLLYCVEKNEDSWM